MTYLLGKDKGVDGIKVAASVIVKDILELLVTLVIFDYRYDSLNIELFNQYFHISRYWNNHAVLCIAAYFNSLFEYKYFSN